MPIDPLDALLRDAKHQERIHSRREERQKRAEQEAAERALKTARIRALREAFDAERFRWFFSQAALTRQAILDAASVKITDLESWRTFIDTQRATSEPKRAKAS